MNLSPARRVLPVLLTYGLTVATLVAFGGEALHPGHHVHLGAEGGHHHHFFVGAHTHRHDPSHPGHDHGHGGHETAAGSAMEEPGDGEPTDSQEPDTGPGLIDGFTLEAPRAPAGVGSPLLASAKASTAVTVSLPASPIYLPGGARAPPAVSLV